MKFICIVGSSVQKILLPLLQFPERYSSVLLLTPGGEKQTAAYISAFLSEQFHTTEAGSSPDIQIIPFSYSPDYDSVHDNICAILWDSFINNEPSVINISGGSAEMILAAVQAAHEMNIPIMYVNSEKLDIQTIHWLEDGIHTEISEEKADFNGLSVREVLALSNFYPSYLETDESLPGIQYEREIFKEFEKAKENNLFDDVDHNIILTWNRNTHMKNEIDLVFMRQQVLGFISIKSGKGIQTKAIFKKASSEVKNIYPDWLMKLPCLRVLLSRYPINPEKKKKLLKNNVLVIDNVWTEDNITQAIGLISAATDKIITSRQHPNLSFYEQFPEYADAGNDF